MEKTTETWVTTPKRPVSTTHQNACLVHIYPTGPSIGTRYVLNNQPVVLGRGEDCDIRINDQSVSRRHVRIEPNGSGYVAIDLDSTNGTYVNDVPTSKAQLKDGDYLRVGNCIYRFLMGGNVEAEYHEEIYRLTIIDALTGVHNKRFLLEFLDRELARSARHNRPLSLVMIDLDFFKAVNDELGHLAGDHALRELANCVRGNVRREDLFARYGGEEFALVLVETTLHDAVEAAERLRLRVEDTVFKFEDHAFRLTISLGVTATQGDPTMTVTELIRRADEKLYQAKSQGRNRVVA
ncbi:MAG: GGDEF domain-containing protein [Gemmataceae bacterium]|nr:GGDEF domain-containing protein [Gemmataceae bacterium]MDW8267048.1 GGDEF domain-containing protein [Gemmataceae bacterium]